MHFWNHATEGSGNKGGSSTPITKGIARSGLPPLPSFPPGATPAGVPQGQGCHPSPARLLGGLMSPALARDRAGNVSSLPCPSGSTFRVHFAGRTGGRCLPVSCSPGETHHTHTHNLLAPVGFNLPNLHTKIFYGSSTEKAASICFPCQQNPEVETDQKTDVARRHCEDDGVKTTYSPHQWDFRCFPHSPCWGTFRRYLLEFMRWHKKWVLSLDVCWGIKQKLESKVVMTQKHKADWPRRYFSISCHFKTNNLLGGALCATGWGNSRVLGASVYWWIP